MQELLKQVSRSFYLTLRILPHSIKAQLSLAYLLARAADTVADTQLVDVQRRREVLLQIRNCIQEACEGKSPTLPDFGQFETAGSGTPAERALLENLGNLLGNLRGFTADDRLRIGKVLDIITHGQETDLVRFGTASEDGIVALAADQELDEYTYHVAGCVGEFWTHMCRVHLFPEYPLNEEILLDRSVRFGKGLQLVNILRDLPKDLRQGRCYLPEEQLAKHGLKPQDLLNAGNMDRFQTLYNDYVRQAENHLAAGWQYTVMLPFRSIRVRLACAWPILIGISTLGKLGKSNVLDPQHPIKLSRVEIRRLIFRSILLYANPKAWNGQFENIRNRASKESIKN